MQGGEKLICKHTSSFWEDFEDKVAQVGDPPD